MPQMAPLPWITLMIMSILTLFLISSMIYFYIPVKNKAFGEYPSRNFCIKW